MRGYGLDIIGSVQVPVMGFNEYGKEFCGSIIEG